MDPVTAGIVIGAGIQAFSAWSGSRAAAKAARQQAKMKQAMANQLLADMKIQETRINEQGQVFKENQRVSYASNGVQTGTGATLVAMEDTNTKITQQIDDLRRDTLFKINQLKTGAAFDKQQASNTENAGSFAAAGAIISGGTSAYKYQTKGT